MAKHAPGSIRDAIMGYLASSRGDASVAEIRDAVSRTLGPVPPSSVRSYLNNNTPITFERTGRARYRLRGKLSGKS